MKRLTLLVIAALCLSGVTSCRGEIARETVIPTFTAVPVENAPGPSWTPEPLPSATAASRPTKTPVSPTPFQSIPSCSSEILDGLPVDVHFPENLLVQQGDPGTIFAVNSQLHKEILTLAQDEHLLSLSPSGDQLLTETYIGSLDYTGRIENLRIITPNLESTYRKISLDELRAWFVGSEPSEEALISFGSTSYWINDDLVYADVRYIPSQDAWPPRSSIPSIINPRDGTWQTGLFDSLPGFNRHGSVLYSPDLTRVFYAADEPILYSTQSKKVLWTPAIIRFPYIGGLWGAEEGPAHSKWSGNSAYLALVIEARFVPYRFKEFYNELIQDILIIDREGNEIARVTNPFEDRLQLKVNGMKWSHDSQRLAFVLHNEAHGQFNESNGLFIYDVETAAISYHCPLAGAMSYPPFDLSWSGDDRYIAIGQGSDQPIYVLGLSKGDVVKVSDSSFLIGWSDQFGE